MGLHGKPRTKATHLLVRGRLLHLPTVRDVLHASQEEAPILRTRKAAPGAVELDFLASLGR